MSHRVSCFPVAVGDDELVGGSGDGDDAAVMQPVVVRTDQHQVVQLGGAAVFPVADVMGVQTAGSPAAGNRTGGVAMLERAAQPAVDHPGRPPGPMTCPSRWNHTSQVASQVR